MKKMKGTITSPKKLNFDKYYDHYKDVATTASNTKDKNLLKHQII